LWGWSSTKGMSIENLYRGLGKIKMIYMHFDRTTKLAIQKTLTTFKLQEGKSITKFIVEFQGAINEATTSRLTFDDAQLVIFLLAKLLPTSH
jgi:phosphatidate phosphatase PAH1